MNFQSCRMSSATHKMYEQQTLSLSLSSLYFLAFSKLASAAAENKKSAPQESNVYNTVARKWKGCKSMHLGYEVFKTDKVARHRPNTDPANFFQERGRGLSFTHACPRSCRALGVLLCGLRNVGTWHRRDTLPLCQNSCSLWWKFFLCSVWT